MLTCWTSGSDHIQRRMTEFLSKSSSRLSETLDKYYIVRYLSKKTKLKGKARVINNFQEAFDNFFASSSCYHSTVEHPCHVLFPTNYLENVSSSLFYFFFPSYVCTLTYLCIVNKFHITFHWCILAVICFAAFKFDGRRWRNERCWCSYSSSKRIGTETGFPWDKAVRRSPFDHSKGEPTAGEL